MEQKIMVILQKMQVSLTEQQLRELNTVLHMVFENCSLTEKSEIVSLDRTWEYDLEEFLMSKTLEGKSTTTIKRYKYELNRLLSYLNKSIKDITSTDISKYLRMYKRIKCVSNQTLHNVRAVFSSFFVGLEIESEYNIIL